MFMDSSSIKKTHAHMLSKSHTVQSVSADPSHTPHHGDFYDTKGTQQLLKGRVDGNHALILTE